MSDITNTKNSFRTVARLSPDIIFNDGLYELQNITEEYNKVAVPCFLVMHLSMLSPRRGGGGEPGHMWGI